MQDFLLPAVLILSLCACATTAEQAAAYANEAEQMVQLYGPACERLGYLNASDPWRNCIVQFSIRDAQRYGGSSYAYPNGFYRPW
jgi:hypothetical protein